MDFIRRLTNREIYGSPLYCSNPFGIKSPERLRFRADSIIPRHVLEAGHTFMGFSNCGRFLISYVVRSSEDFNHDWSGLQFIYKMCFWLFVPNKRVRKVSEVILFDDEGVLDNNLLIGMSQWRMDDKKILVTGHSYVMAESSNSTFYATVTSLPDTQGCSHCVYTEEESEEFPPQCRSRTRTNCFIHGATIHITFDIVPPYPEFNAEIQLRAKDSVIFNTGNFLHVFSLKVLDFSGNIKKRKTESVLQPLETHSVSIPVSSPLRCDIWFKNIILSKAYQIKYKNSNSTRDSSLSILEKEKRLIDLNAQERILRYLMSLYVEPHVQNTPNCGMFEYQASNSPFHYTDRSFTSSTSTDSPMSGSSGDSKTDVTAKPVSKSCSAVMLPPHERKFFKRKNRSGNSKSCNFDSTFETGSTNKMEPTNALKSTASTDNSSPYDVFDIRLAEDVLPERSFSSFRKRRLADKRYEFSEADFSEENVLPLTFIRKRKSARMSSSSPLGLNSSPRSPRSFCESRAGSESPRATLGDINYPRSPRTCMVPSPMMSPIGSDSSEVLKPLNCNKIQEIKDDVLIKTKDSCLTSKKGSAGIAELDNLGRKLALTTQLSCCASVLRSYVQWDDDNMSVITEIEDEANQCYPHPVAVPLSVHGGGYAPLQMLSNSKIDKCQAPVITVLQKTLDIEMLCNEIASIICLASGKQYCSCRDFDASVVDVCQEQGSVTVVVAVLIQAIEMDLVRSSKERSDPNLKEPLDENGRKTFESYFSFAWSPHTEHCQVLYCGDLTPLEQQPVIWQPVKSASLKMSSGPVSQPRYMETPTMTNSLSVMKDMSLTEFSDRLGVISLFKGNQCCNDDFTFQSSDSLTLPLLEYLEASSEEEDGQHSTISDIDD